MGQTIEYFDHLTFAGLTGFVISPDDQGLVWWGDIEQFCDMEPYEESFLLQNPPHPTRGYGSQGNTTRALGPFVADGPSWSDGGMFKAKTVGDKVDVSFCCHVAGKEREHLCSTAGPSLTGNSDSLLCFVFSPDGRALAGGSADHAVHVWDLPDGVLRHTLKGHTDEVTCLAFSPDGQILATGSADQTVRVWSVSDGTLLHTLTGVQHTIDCLAFSPDGRVLTFIHRKKIIESENYWRRWGFQEVSVQRWAWKIENLQQVSAEQISLEEWSVVKRWLREKTGTETERKWAAFLSELTRRSVVMQAHTLLSDGQTNKNTSFEPKALELLKEMIRDERTDARLAIRACIGLDQKNHPEGIDCLCTRWMHTRELLLAETMTCNRYVARHPVEVRVWSALQSDQEAVVKECGMDGFLPLLHACQDADQILAKRARQVLVQMLDEHVEMQDRLFCKIFYHEDPLAREIALTQKYVPQDKDERVIFYFLTEQWEKCDRLDFDRSLLTNAYRRADKTLQRNILEQARWFGRIDWIKNLAIKQQGTFSEKMRDEDWECAASLLYEHHKGSEMWELVWRAPLTWSAWLLIHLQKMGWQPQKDQDRAGFAKLIRLAETCYAEKTPPSQDIATYSIELEGSNEVDQMTCFALNVSGTVLAGGGRDKLIRLWRLSDGGVLHTLSGHSGKITCLAFSPDGKMLASGSSDSTVRLWRLSDGVALQTLERHSAPITCLTFSPDGKLLASSGNERDDIGVCLWRLSDGMVLQILKDKNRKCLAFSPNAKLLASLGTQRLKLWNLSDGVLLHKKKASKCLAFRPDSNVLAHGRLYGAVQLWSLSDGTILQEFDIKTGADFDVLAFSADARLLIGKNWQNAIYVWLLPYGRTLDWFQSDGRTSQITDYRGDADTAISPDGRIVVGRNRYDKTVTVWTVRRFILNGLMQEKTVEELISLIDIPLIENTLQNEQVTDSERKWLKFTLELMRWQQRFDIDA